MSLRSAMTTARERKGGGVERSSAVNGGGGDRGVIDRNQEAGTEVIDISTPVDESPLDEDETGGGGDAGTSSRKEADKMWNLLVEKMPVDHPNRDRWSQEKEQRGRACEQCENQGGVMVQCCKTGCHRRFHPSCALDAKCGIEDMERVEGLICPVCEPLPTCQVCTKLLGDSAAAHKSCPNCQDLFHAKCIKSSASFECPGCKGKALSKEEAAAVQRRISLLEVYKKRVTPALRDVHEAINLLHQLNKDGSRIQDVRALLHNDAIWVLDLSGLCPWALQQLGKAAVADDDDMEEETGTAGAAATAAPADSSSSSAAFEPVDVVDHIVLGELPLKRLISMAGMDEKSVSVKGKSSQWTPHYTHVLGGGRGGKKALLHIEEQLALLERLVTQGSSGDLQDKAKKVVDILEWVLDVSPVRGGGKRHLIKPNDLSDFVNRGASLQAVSCLDPESGLLKAKRDSLQSLLEEFPKWEQAAQPFITVARPTRNKVAEKLPLSVLVELVGDDVFRYVEIPGRMALESRYGEAISLRSEADAFLKPTGGNKGPVSVAKRKPKGPTKKQLLELMKRVWDLWNKEDLCSLEMNEKRSLEFAWRILDWCRNAMEALGREHPSDVCSPYISHMLASDYDLLMNRHLEPGVIHPLMTEEWKQDLARDGYVFEFVTLDDEAEKVFDLSKFMGMGLEDIDANLNELCFDFLVTGTNCDDLMSCLWAYLAMRNWVHLANKWKVTAESLAYERDTLPTADEFDILYTIGLVVGISQSEMGEAIDMIKAHFDPDPRQVTPAEGMDSPSLSHPSPSSKGAKASSSAFKGGASPAPGSRSSTSAADGSAAASQTDKKVKKKAGGAGKGRIPSPAPFAGSKAFSRPPSVTAELESIFSSPSSSEEDEEELTTAEHIQQRGAAAQQINGTESSKQQPPLPIGGEGENGEIAAAVKKRKKKRLITSEGEKEREAGVGGGGENMKKLKKTEQQKQQQQQQQQAEEVSLMSFSSPTAASAAAANKLKTFQIPRKKDMDTSSATTASAARDTATPSPSVAELSVLRDTDSPADPPIPKKTKIRPPTPAAVSQQKSSVDTVSEKGASDRSKFCVRNGCNRVALKTASYCGGSCLVECSKTLLGSFAGLSGELALHWLDRATKSLAAEEGRELLDDKASQHDFEPFPIFQNILHHLGEESVLKAAVQPVKLAQERRAGDPPTLSKLESLRIGSGDSLSDAQNGGGRNTTDSLPSSANLWRRAELRDGSRRRFWNELYKACLAHGCFGGNTSVALKESAFLAYELEAYVRYRFPDDESYKSHYRKLWMALKLQGDLIRRVVLGKLAVDTLANMPPEDLAGEELKRQQDKGMVLAQKSMIVSEESLVVSKTKDNIRLVNPNARESPASSSPVKASSSTDNNKSASIKRPPIPFKIPQRASTPSFSDGPGSSRSGLSPPTAMSPSYPDSDLDRGGGGGGGTSSMEVEGGGGGGSDSLPAAPASLPAGWSYVTAEPGKNRNVPPLGSSFTTIYQLHLTKSQSGVASKSLSLAIASRTESCLPIASLLPDPMLLEGWAMKEAGPTFLKEVIQSAKRYPERHLLFHVGAVPVYRIGAMQELVRRLREEGRVGRLVAYDRQAEMDNPAFHGGTLRIHLVPASILQSLEEFIPFSAWRTQDLDRVALHMLIHWKAPEGRSGPLLPSLSTMGYGGSTFARIPPPSRPLPPASSPLLGPRTTPSSSGMHSPDAAGLRSPELSEDEEEREEVHSHLAARSPPKLGSHPPSSAAVPLVDPFETLRREATGEGLEPELKDKIEKTVLFLLAKPDTNGTLQQLRTKVQTDPAQAGLTFVFDGQRGHQYFSRRLDEKMKERPLAQHHVIHGLQPAMVFPPVPAPPPAPTKVYPPAPIPYLNTPTAPPAPYGSSLAIGSLPLGSLRPPPPCSVIPPQQRLGSELQARINRVTRSAVASSSSSAFSAVGGVGERRPDSRGSSSRREDDGSGRHRVDPYDQKRPLPTSRSRSAGREREQRRRLDYRREERREEAPSRRDDRERDRDRDRHYPPPPPPPPGYNRGSDRSYRGGDDRDRDREREREREHGRIGPFPPSLDHRDRDRSSGRPRDEYRERGAAPLPPPLPPHHRERERERSRERERERSKSRERDSGDRRGPLPPPPPHHRERERDRKRSRSREKDQRDSRDRMRDRERDREREQRR